jgi:excisionase family DNA binding protein
MNGYSTGEVASQIGVSKNTLLRWLYAGKISEPRHSVNGGQDVRIWSERDLSRVRKYKDENYWKGRGGSRPKT